MSVDLPAPFWPSTPTTSPGERSTVTSSTAWTPPKRLQMLRISTRGVPLRAMPPPSAPVTIVDHVEPHGGDQHQADDDVAHRAGHAEQHHAVVQALHDDCADRSEERRVGQEYVSKWRIQGEP